MTTIVTRSGKAAPLTNTELDANFTNLNTDKLEKGSNLSDLQSVSQARTNLGLGDLATQNKAALAGPVVLTDSSTSPALKITQTGTGNALVVEDAASDTTPFVIDASGKVIVGHTAAVTGAYGDNATLFNIGAGFVARQFNHAYSADSFAPVVELGKSRNATAGAHTVVTSGDELGTLRFAGSDGTAFKEAARIQVIVDGTPGTNDMPGRLVFSTTADGSSTPTERMRIDSAGNVGIGGTSIAGFKISTYGNIAGATTAYNYYGGGVFQSDVTVNGIGCGTFLGTQAAAFTLAALSHHRAAQGTIGAGSTVTNQFGFEATNSLTGATNNYGFYGNIAAGTGRYNFYAAGTADNVFNGNIRVINGSATIGYGTGAGGTVNQTGGRTTGVTLSKPTGSITLVSAAGSTSWQSFTVTNTVVSADDVIKVCQKSGADKYMIHVTNVATGSFQITFATTGGTTTEQPVFSFAVIKGAIA